MRYTRAVGGRGRWWLALAALAVPACSSPSQVFSCSESSQCESVGVPGTCESNGFCSFPDPECPSGRRYGDLAGPLSETCVDDGTGETGDSTEASSSTSVSPASSSGTLEESTTSSGGGDTVAITSGPQTGSSSGEPTTTGEGSSSSGGVVVDDGLVGWWRLNDDPSDGVLDASGNGNDGVCLGPCPVRDPEAGTYLFDGNQIIAIPGAAFDSDTFTIAVWTRPNARSAEIDPIVFTKPVGEDVWNSWGMHYDLGFGELEFVIGNGAGNSRVTLPMPDTEGWHHYAGRYDGSAATLFVDGVEFGTLFTPEGFFEVDDSDVYIGGDQDGETPPEPRYSGELDDVRYYDRVLSDGEIAELAAMPL